MITIIDYNMGNIKSIMNMLKRIGVESMVSNNLADIRNASKLILPGVGSFDAAMSKIQEYNLQDTLNETVLNKKTPILGICLGMQLMAKTSEEGKAKGLGWFDADVIKFTIDKLPIPHMGWNGIRCTDTFLTSDDARFYFVHSYHVHCNDPKDVVATTNYGKEFTSIISKDNIHAVQFHPEKSHKFGMELLKNFAEYQYV